MTVSAPAARVLLVDPDPRVWAELPALLTESGLEVHAAQSLESALEQLTRSAFDVVLADVDEVGSDFLRTARGTPGDPLVVLCDTFGTPEDGSALLAAGAFDFLPRPAVAEQAAACVGRGLRQRRLQAENRALRQVSAGARQFEQLLSRDPRLLRLFELVESVADTSASLLIEGESGTGKTQLARAVHRRSTRAAGPFVEVNCGALPSSLLESELFGHQKGAFTGADRDRQGKFEAAHGGTIFLDEIATASAELQVKLLRVLESGRLERLGEHTTRTVDVRLLAATNRPLRAEVAAGRFREDLYYRIQVIALEVPPLRERPSDVALLATTFAERFAAEFGRPMREFDDDAWRALAAYPWPGNVRELEHAVQRAVLLARGRGLGLADLPPEIRGAAGEAPAAAEGPSGEEPPLGPLRRMLEIPERRFLVRALGACAGNRGAAARLLDVTRSTLFNKLRKHGLLHHLPDGRTRRPAPGPSDPPQ